MSNFNLLILMLLLILSAPMNLWATTACGEARQRVIEADALDMITHKTLKKDLLQQALILCPNQAEAHTKMAMVLETENNTIEALYHYQQALKTQPHSSPAWIGIGHIYAQKKQFLFSLEAYLQACDQPQTRQPIVQLLQNQRYRTVVPEQIMESQNLKRLYDKNHLQTLYQMANKCHRRYKSSVLKQDQLKVILQPVVVFYNFEFKENQSTLKPFSALQLDEIAAVLFELKAKSVVIRVSHSSTQNSPQKNWQLSQNRAKSIATALIQRGIQKRLLRSFGYSRRDSITKKKPAMNEVNNPQVEIEIKN